MMPQFLGMFTPAEEGGAGMSVTGVTMEQVVKKFEDDIVGLITDACRYRKKHKLP